jgi:hypothetical protein
MICDSLWFSHKDQLVDAHMYQLSSLLAFALTSVTVAMTMTVPFLIHRSRARNRTCTNYSIRASTTET